RRVAARLCRGDRALIADFRAALRSLHRAHELNIETLLHYDVTHHRVADRIMAEEARRQPHYAASLDLYRMSPDFNARAEEEVTLADRVLVLSSFHKWSFIESGVDERKLLMAPYGVDLKLFRPVPHRSDGTFRVLFVGRISQVKGISYLIDAFEPLAGPDTELL